MHINTSGVPSNPHGFLGASVVKNLPVNVRDTEDVGLSPGSREGNGNPLHYSYLGNPMRRGIWLAIVHGVAKELDTTE